MTVRIRSQTSVSCYPSDCFIFSHFFSLKKKISLFGCTGSVAACGIFDLHCKCRNFSCRMWDLDSWPGTESGSPASGAQSLSHWTSREVPIVLFLSRCFTPLVSVTADTVSSLPSIHPLHRLLHCSWWRYTQRHMNYRLTGYINFVKLFLLICWTYPGLPAFRGSL